MLPFDLRLHVAHVLLILFPFFFWLVLYPDYESDGKDEESG